MIRPLVHVQPHVRSRPFSKEFEAIHSELFAAHERDTWIEVSIALFFAPAVDELLADREIA